ncbi:hypothetical protein HanRHA438_Chr00c10g0848361 [Helianthus annuus]|uniref:Uncharacterized protein n=1 Tax=Helianthus annuus TaxID=4232 RepID=A0A9K3IHP8_HELAN|nr:hypothetical protein HanXRQr2_Chr08g0353371 [Helianthus annuus]KAJ0548211.1 hypothetical protein HanIR_Chr08g0381071 [Helianthus annuus]KAJ0954692.1 hypothetical protein HanRHA438_Chr00c10g0848361 [Helianthus annuus]
MLCFQGLFFCPEVASLLLHNFCIYHIGPPGCERAILYLRFNYDHIIFNNQVLIFICFECLRDHVYYGGY